MYHLSLPNAYKLMCFERNFNGNRDVKFLIGIIGHCTDQRNLLYLSQAFTKRCNSGNIYRVLKRVIDKSTDKVTVQFENSILEPVDWANDKKCSM